jgi:hypothetical protein
VSQTKAELIKGLNINASAPATALQIDASGNVNIDSNTLYVDATNNRVGIGTTAPNAKLTITETANANAIVVRNADTNASILQFGINTAIPAAYIQSTKDGSGTAQALAFYGAASEMARFDSSSRLLVGTSSAYGLPCQFMVQGYDGNSTNVPAIMQLVRSDTDIVSGDELGQIRFSGSETGTGGQGVYITGEADGTWTGSSFPSRLKFSTTADGASSPTERMRIRADGGVSSYAPSGTTWDLRWNGDTDQVRSIQIIGGASGILSGGTERLRIWNNGDAQNRAGVWGSLSDAKLKTNITDAASQWDDIKSLRVRKYNLLDDLEHAHIGVIAQELELTSPGLVTSHPDLDESGCETGEYTKAVKNSILYMKAVKALQEAMERIEQLEQRLTDAGIA